MDFKHWGKGFAWRNAFFPYHLGTMQLGKTKRFLPLIFICSIATALYSQSGDFGSSQNSGSDSPTALDCSDPLMANSSQCSGTSQGVGFGSGQGGFPGAQSPQSRSTATPTNGNYSDIEQLSRQGQERYQEILPPEPLTEFQNFIISTSGKNLPIFGADLFRRVPSTFAPLDMTPVPSDYVLGPGDELRLRVWGQVSFQANVRVDRSGEVFLPQVGSVHVAGIPASGLAQHLREALGRVYHNFDLTADLGQIRSIQVYISGQAHRPGVYTISSLSTLVDAVFASGGPSVQGSLRHVQLRRGSAMITDFDLYDLLINGDKSKDVKLESGDVIYIPPVGPQAAVLGSVKRPAIYELIAGEPLSALLGNAGGASTVASAARLSIERIEEHHNRQAMEVGYDAAGLATPVREGDLVRVFSIVPKYENTVTLRGNTANPGRFAWKPGMHISDLIPDKDSLITRNYWWRRTRLGLPAPEELDAPTPPVVQWNQAQNPFPYLNPCFSQFPDQSQNPNQQQNQNQYQYQDQTADPNQNQASNQNQIQPQNPYSLSRNPYSTQDPNLIPCQLPLNQDQYSTQNPNNSAQNPVQNQGQNQSQIPNSNAQQRAGGSSLGAAENATLAAKFPGPLQKTEIRQLAPEIDWDYAVVERLDHDTLKSLVLPFDLGKLVLQHDGSQDLELQPDDVVSIFSEADFRVPIAHQTKQVTLNGEFAHAGVYTAQAGETLRQLVVRAGGLTADAYLYGSEFTRQTTRALQQARIDEYVQSLGMQIERSNLALAASSVSQPQDLASSAAAATNEHELLVSLRQIRATGRIVLQFSSDSNGVSNIPDVPLEDGDFFLVPPVPASVNVVGAVYDQNSFLYVKGAKVGTFLRSAGGVNRDGDHKHEFVIRANGDVVSQQKNKGSLWNSKDDFMNLPMNPGDTIVVPEKTFRPTALRSFIDWSQLFSQFAFDAAAISVLR